LLIISFGFSILALITSYLVYQLSPKEFKMLESQKPNILHRNFSEGKVYYNSYQITTISNSNYNSNIDKTIIINYTLAATVLQSDEFATNFVAVLQKRSEHLYDEDNVL
jgi:hypothetical protein